MTELNTIDAAIERAATEILNGRSVKEVTDRAIAAINADPAARDDLLARAVEALIGKRVGFVPQRKAAACPGRPRSSTKKSGNNPQRPDHKNLSQVGVAF